MVEAAQGSAARDKVLEALFALVPVAVIYFAGWAYLSSYLGEFGLDSTHMNVPLTTVLVSAFLPLSGWKIISVILAVFAVFTGSLFMKDDAKRVARKLAPMAVFVTVILLLFLIRSESRDLAHELAESVWHGRHLGAEQLPNAANTEDAAYIDYQRCRQGRRLVQIVSFPEQAFLLCRSELNPCIRGTIFLVNSTGSIVMRANIAREPREGEDGC